MITGVVFWFVLSIPGAAPIEYSTPMRDLATCLFEVHEFHAKPPHTLLVKGGKLIVGCSVEHSKTEEI